ncbi:MAG: hypothetical protein CM15mP106_4350 [Candidatus Neomarinimicrobiota bacterium]|nr:MAG: hypothetical protein CM15mP106_4350 [Candidatus Neomarinimicrobiota bacterium]
MNLQKEMKRKIFIKKNYKYLNLYAKMVSNGSWKDYSFTSGIKKFHSVFIELQETCFENFKILNQDILMKNVIKDKNGAIVKKNLKI